ncbi:hypothetical protein BZA77DRAFT_349350 [Pyronema omphalodes]|nr:hypothetical protein BZA77DRAFT_349350 [Pyronema omphalodes]
MPPQPFEEATCVCAEAPNGHVITSRAEWNEHKINALPPPVANLPPRAKEELPPGVNGMPQKSFGERTCVCSHDPKGHVVTSEAEWLSHIYLRQAVSRPKIKVYLRRPNRKNTKQNSSVIDKVPPKVQEELPPKVQEGLPPGVNGMPQKPFGERTCVCSHDPNGHVVTSEAEWISHIYLRQAVSRPKIKVYLRRPNRKNTKQNSSVIDKIQPKVQEELPPKVNGVPQQPSEEITCFCADAPNGHAFTSKAEWDKHLIDALPSLAKEELPPLVNEELPPSVNEELPPLSNDELPPLSNDEMPPLVNDELPTRLNKKLPPKLQWNLRKKSKVDYRINKREKLPPKLKWNLRSKSRMDYRINKRRNCN